MLPAFAAAYLVAGPSPVRTRLWRLLGGTAAMVVSGGWYLALVELAVRVAPVCRWIAT